MHPFRITFIVCFAACCTASGLAQSPIRGDGASDERAAVRAVLDQYVRVTDFRDSAAIAKSFHPTAVLSSVTTGGALKAMTQDEWWERVVKIPSDTPPRQSSIAL